jgi:hypothetical protein
MYIGNKHNHSKRQYGMDQHPYSITCNCTACDPARAKVGELLKELTTRRAMTRADKFPAKWQNLDTAVAALRDLIARMDSDPAERATDI